MIALDTSALAAVAFAEPGHEAIAAAISAQNCIVGAPTLFELHSVLRGRGTVEPQAFLDDLLSIPNISVRPFGMRHFELARAAFDRFGKGRGHSAGLNFGDCLAYAVARAENCPLLFKGNDFIHTDIHPAIAP